MTGYFLKNLYTIEACFSDTIGTMAITITLLLLSKAEAESLVQNESFSHYRKDSVND
jgi:hypothetical protein